VSKKRNKNARKKAVKKKALSAPRPDAPQPGASIAPGSVPPGSVAPGWAPPPEDDERQPIADAVATKEGGGAINAMRTRLTPGAGRDGETMLTKRRSVGELSLWLAGACAVFWLLWKLIRTLNPPI